MLESFVLSIIKLIKNMFIKVKVYPESKQDELIKESKDKFVLKIKEKPKQGLANMKAIEILAKHFKVSQNKIFLIKGHKERNKIFKINNTLY